MSVLVPIGDFSRMTHLSVKALRFYHDQGLLEPARIDPATGYRFYDTGQVPVAQVIRRFRDLAEAWAWGTDAFAEIYGRIDQAGLTPAGPGGALFPAEFFEVENADLTAFVPVGDAVGDAVAAGGSVPGGGRAELVTIPGIEAAVMVHAGRAGDIDQTYGALGTVVAERAIGVESPIREYYLVPFTEPDPDRHRTEICWPVFQTA
jgi:effector-binding domain-containing protein